MRWVYVAGLLAVLASTAESHSYGYAKSTKCYQCAYSKDDLVIEQIQVPRTVYDEVQVPRTVLEDIQVSSVVYDDVTVTRTEYDDVEFPRVVEKEVSVPRVVYTTQHLPSVVHDIVAPAKSWQSVKSVKSVGYGHTVPRVVYTPVTVTSLEYDIQVVTETVYEIKQVPRVVEDTKQVPRTVFDTQQVSKIVYDTETVSRTVIDIQNITKTVQGGWQKCLNAFGPAEAELHGIDVWDCHDNCYTRIENGGENLYRGCYKGEFGVDPHLTGCHEQAGALWCFCEGQLCNNGGH